MSYRPGHSSQIAILPGVGIGGAKAARGVEVGDMCIWKSSPAENTALPLQTVVCCTPETQP